MADKEVVPGGLNAGLGGAERTERGVVLKHQRHLGLVVVPYVEAMFILPPLSPAIAMLNPWPSDPMTLSKGTSQSSKITALQKRCIVVVVQQ